MEQTTLTTEEVTETTEQTTVLSQKDAVFTFALAALNGTVSTDGQVLADLVRSNKEVRKTVRQQLFDGIREGTIKYAPVKSDGDLKKYCSSLINNWLKKDPRFN